MASDDQSAKKRLKKAQKQPSVSKKVKVTEDEKAKQEAKKAKEAEKLKAEKKRNAEIAAKIAQATKRISSQNQQSSGNPRQPTEINLEGDNIHTLILPAFREQQNPTISDAPVTSSRKQAAVKRKQTKPKTPKSPGLHHQEGINSHPLALPAFRKQPRLSTSDPASNKRNLRIESNIHRKIAVLVISLLIMNLVIIKRMTILIFPLQPQQQILLHHEKNKTRKAKIKQHSDQLLPYPHLLLAVRYLQKSRQRMF